MNRMQFIQTIMELYPNTFHPDNEKQFKGWVTRYKETIPENWDFEKLLKIFDREWKSTVVPPHPSFFYEYKSEVKPYKDTTYRKEIIDISDEEQKAGEEKIKEYKENFKNLINNMLID